MKNLEIESLLSYFSRSLSNEAQTSITPQCILHCGMSDSVMALDKENPVDDSNIISLYNKN